MAVNGFREEGKGECWRCTPVFVMVRGQSTYHGVIDDQYYKIPNIFRLRVKEETLQVFQRKIYKPYFVARSRYIKLLIHTLLEKR
jgi:hypothetical protein